MSDDFHKTIEQLRLLRWEPKYHGPVKNDSVPGGIVDMWILVDSETGESIVSLGVPKGRSDIAGFIAACCGNPMRWVTAMMPRNRTAQGIFDPEDKIGQEANALGDALFAAIYKHCGDKQANGWVINEALAAAWFAFCGQLSHDMRCRLLFEFLQLATTDYDPGKSE
jgi:hypothetical protein